jgi:prolipoprotein diacylglyceryltransferase
MKNLFLIFWYSVLFAIQFYSIAFMGLFFCGLLPFFDMPYTYQKELMSEYGYYIAFLGAVYGGRLGWIIYKGLYDDTFN